MSETFNLQPGDSGRTIAAKVGDTVVLALPENPTTGVRWNESELPGAVELVDDDYGPVAADQGIGGENVRVLSLRLRQAGRHPLSLSRMQIWEGAQSTDATFALTLDVSD